MLGVVALSEGWSEVSPSYLLMEIGRLLPGGPARGSGWAYWSGLGLHVSLGALFGLLYGVCQQQSDTRGFLAVGVFYGVLLWIGGRLVVGSAFPLSLQAVTRSFMWLMAHMGFGIWLAAIATWAQARKPAAVAIVPLD